MSATAFASLIRSRSDSAENPPKTTEWIAPIRAHASIANTASGTIGMVLPRRADEQATAPGFVAVERVDLQPGDLVFFNTLRRSFSHVGIYVGANRFVHAPRTGASIRTEDMSFAYWAKRYNGARRVTTAAAAAKTVEPAEATPAGGE